MVTNIKEPLLYNLLDMKQNQGETNLCHGISTGFFDLDNVFMGLKEGDLLTIGSKTGMGKTSLSYRIALNVAVNNQTTMPVLIFQSSLSNKNLSLHMLCTQSNIDQRKIESSSLDQRDLQILSSTIDKVAKRGKMYFFDGDYNPSFEEIEKECMLVKEEIGVGLVIIDNYDSLPSYDSVNKSSACKADIIKRIALKIGCPFIINTQLLTKVKDEFNEGHKLSCFNYDKGRSHQFGDFVLAIDEANISYQDAPNRDYKKVILRILKNRRGVTKSIPFLWVPRYRDFKQMPRNDENN